MKEQWAAKVFDGDQQANSGALGQVEILQRQISMTYDEFEQAVKGDDDE